MLNATAFGLIWAVTVISSGMMVGAAGLATIVPALYAAGYIFGLDAILWFLWVGVILLRGSSSVAAYRAASSSA